MFILGIFTAFILVVGFGLCIYAIFESTLFGKIKIACSAFCGGVLVTIGLTIVLYHILFTT